MSANAPKVVSDSRQTERASLIQLMGTLSSMASDSMSLASCAENLLLPAIPSTPSDVGKSESINPGSFTEQISSIVSDVIEALGEANRALRRINEEFD